jgi:hypothetical protein
VKEIRDNDNHTPDNKKHEPKILLSTSLEQNCLQFNDQFYKQKEGLAMVAPTSAVLA